MTTPDVIAVFLCFKLLVAVTLSGSKQEGSTNNDSTAYSGLHVMIPHIVMLYIHLYTITYLHAVFLPSRILQEEQTDPGVGSLKRVPDL